ncbi:glycosyl transferases group 1-domain-containing protein [Gautieria morchelliformis]|nr:glycosyl transferases group 1-domain-containing protein [Gautieria morchelliformis]
MLLQVALTLATIVVLWAAFRYKSAGYPRRRSAAVVVLGDIGRSPRIMYHAQSFALNGFETYVVGYKGSREVLTSHVRFVYLSEPPAFIARMSHRLFLLLAPVKVLFQLVTIIAALFYRIEHAPEFILVQNPPSIPTLALVWLAGMLRGSKIIIDWHNLGYSILALKLGNNHILVRLAKKFEMAFGRSAFAHLFVTRAMKDYLAVEWSLHGYKIVFHDRPPTHFHSSSPSEVHDLFCRITPSLARTLPTFLPPFNLPTSTPVTTLLPQDSRSSSYDSSILSTSSPLPALRADRPALVVSSTSWTEDEDFSILIAALAQYEQQARLQEKHDSGHLPKLLVIVTGKGPLRERYMREMREVEETRHWEWVRCRSLWLEPEDYPLLLGSADVGVSLHASSSALDLPMKVVDMFGCGLPVLALDFKCLGELVVDGRNGLVFRTADELASHLASTLASFPRSPRLSALQAFFSNKSDWDWCTWNENWDRVLRPIVTHEIAAKEILLKEKVTYSVE